MDNVKDYCIIGLLPSYLERKNSSLVYMTDKLIDASGHQIQWNLSRMNIAKLEHVLKELEQEHQTDMADRCQLCFAGLS